eukprot:jgi/Bigna1/142294/aug1.68_g17002
MHQSSIVKAEEGGDNTIRLVVVGDLEAGKQSFFESIPNSTDASIGLRILTTKQIQVNFHGEEGEEYKCENMLIYDTPALNERIKGPLRKWIHAADGVLYIFNPSSSKSWTTLSDFLSDELKTLGGVKAKPGQPVYVLEHRDDKNEKAEASDYDDDSPSIANDEECEKSSYIRNTYGYLLMKTNSSDGQAISSILQKMGKEVRNHKMMKHKQQSFRCSIM